MTSNRWVWLPLALALVLAACQPAQPGGPSGDQAQTADFLIVNGKVFAADSAGTTAEAVAVRGNKILRVGTTTRMSASCAARRRASSMPKAASVAPGFNDSHVHFIAGGIRAGRRRPRRAEHPSRRSRTRFAQFAAAHAGRGWLRGRGWLYSPFPGGSPTRAQLDAACPIARQ